PYPIPMCQCKLNNVTPTTDQTFIYSCAGAPRVLHSFPTRRSSDLHRSWRALIPRFPTWACTVRVLERYLKTRGLLDEDDKAEPRSEEHTSELQSLRHLVCRLLLEKKTVPILIPVLVFDVVPVYAAC